MAKSSLRAVGEKRATRIDKDIKTTQKHGRVLSFLYDIMWSYRYYPYFAATLLLAEAVLGYLIIQKVPCTWHCHYVERKGERAMD
jgi:hypothetical protein